MIAARIGRMDALHLVVRHAQADRVAGFIAVQRLHGIPGYQRLSDSGPRRAREPALAKPPQSHAAQQARESDIGGDDTQAVAGGARV